MKPIVLLTGATGFLGAQIARWLVRQAGCTLVALVRAAGPDQARQRLAREWWDWPDLRAALDGRVEVVAGDVTRPRLGLDDAVYAQLAARLTHILHAAADVRLFAPLEELRQVNVEGTRHVLELAHAARAQGGLERLAHVSTAYVAGKRSGPVGEEELTDRYGFSTPYERSKYEAEVLVRAEMERLPITILRPGMIVGDSTSGAVKTFNTLYYPLRLYLTGRLWVAPARPSLRVEFAPVDYVAEAVVKLALHPQAAGRAFHLTPPMEALPTLAEVADLARRWAAQELGIDLPKPIYVDIGGVKQFAPLVAKFAGRDLAALTRLLPYFHKQPVFLRANSDALLGPYPHRWEDFFPNLLRYAAHYSFWHRSTRTVHEQILYRLRSRSKPIRYHDLRLNAATQGRLREEVRGAAEMHAEILAAAAALRALGIQPGERVAIWGHNSTRYLALATACGIIGAVSTPLYVTAPPAEIESLLKDCQARALLVGAPEAFERLSAVRFDGPIVSFCPEPPREDLTRPVMAWEEFLAGGADRRDEPLPIVALDAPAALFYTSGTTGQPKGVIYRHEQLRWLAETLASMYPWHERHRWGAYLSYLPMSHVVEGILAFYSPYYVPAALDIYFLDAFQALQPALQTARPTIFFSVPRFFEKVRAAFLQNRLAASYVKLGEGPLRRALRPLLRRGLLRRTGLTGCRQMLVGSAPSAPELLGFFQDLGIEVYNAYGLTEAPLITLNRLGHNHIGTVGVPLPETEIHLAEDGEIWVRGPQVAKGYFNQRDSREFADGWFRTGDLGALTEAGDLVINGRKKDMIITSYAKNIFPARIEDSLRTLPGIAEAMLIGEGRPYCAALLWIEENTFGPQTVRCVEEGIARINAQLSHPEQIKRWAILAGSLTVENGSLTTTLKVKRARVAERLAAEIDALYRGEDRPDVFLSQGMLK